METYLTTRAVWSPTIYRQVLCPAQNESCGHNFDGPAKDISCSTDGVRHSLPLHTALRFNATENNSMPQIADYSVYVLRYNVIRAHCEKPQDYQRTHCTEHRHRFWREKIFSTLKIQGVQSFSFNFTLPYQLAWWESLCWKQQCHAFTSEGEKVLLTKTTSGSIVPNAMSINCCMVMKADKQLQTMEFLA